MRCIQCPDDTHHVDTSSNKCGVYRGGLRTATATVRVSEAVGERDECYKRTTWEIAPGCDSCLVCRQTELYDVVCKKEGCNERGGGPDVGCDVDESEDGTEAEDAAGSRRLAPATTRSAATAPAAATG